MLQILTVEDNVGRKMQHRKQLRHMMIFEVLNRELQLACLYLEPPVSPKDMSSSSPDTLKVIAFVFNVSHHVNGSAEVLLEFLVVRSSPIVPRSKIPFGPKIWYVGSE